MANTAPYDWLEEFEDHVRDAAASAYHLVSTVSAVWAEVKASPAYGPLIALAVKTAEGALAAHGVPVAGLTSVADAVVAVVDSYAAADPNMKTATSPAVPAKE